MCFNKKSHDQVAQKATRDIYGIKVLIKEKSELRSPYMYSKWRLGVTKRAHKFDPKRAGLINVNEGLHCYKTLDEAVQDSQGAYKEKVFLVVIPKGTMYYENDTQFCAQRMYLAREIRIPKI